MMKFDVNKLQWTRKPVDYSITDDRIEISFKAIFTDMEMTECKWLAHKWTAIGFGITIK